MDANTANTNVTSECGFVATRSLRIWNRPMLVPCMAVFLCFWGFITQVSSPWKLNDSLLWAQCIAMIAGLSVLIAVQMFSPPRHVPAGVLWTILGALTAVAVFLAWSGPGRSWYASIVGWLALPLLLACTLRPTAEERLWRRCALVCLAWSLLFLATFPGHGVRGIRVPLLALAVFLPFWRRRWCFGTVLATASGILTFLYFGTVSWRLHRLIPCLFSSDPMGAQFAAFKVRHALESAGWTGMESSHLPLLINGSTHYTLGLLGARWGWLGLLLWFGIQVWLIGNMFRMARRYRGRLGGDLLAALSFVILLATVVSVLMALGMGGYGVALPLLGLDPGLAFLELLTLALGQHLQFG